MDFLPVTPGDVPKRTYQCLAVISVGGTAGGRRLSTDSNSDKEGGGALSRMMGGGQRRKSVQGGVSGGRTSGDGNAGSEGVWYWRCRVGVSSQNLVVMPISNPPNPLLTAQPPPLSGALDASKTKNAATHNGTTQHDEGIGSKFMGGLRRASAAFVPHGKESGPASTAPHEPTIPDSSATTQLPRASGTEADNTTASSSSAPISEQTATNDTASVPAETGWPGMIDGQALHGIIVPLSSLHKVKVRMGGRDRIDNMYVSVPVGSAIAGKSGVLRFEFDKDWVGGKAEAELLMHNIETGIANASPSFQNFKLGADEKKDKQYEAGWQDKVRGKW